MYNNFYNGSLRRTLIAFGSMFDDINITLDNGKNVQVPIHYAQKEKFIEVLASQPDKTSRIKNISYPVMGYEIIALNYAPERNKNQLNKIKNCTTGEFMYNRVPYDIMIEMYVATKRLDDGFKIAEQILPNFAPSLSIRVNEHPDMGIESDMVFTLTASSFSVEYEDDFSTVRNIMWQFSFTVKTYMYKHVQDSVKIQKAVVNAINGYNDDDIDIMGKFTTLVDNDTGEVTKTSEGF